MTPKTPQDYAKDLTKIYDLTEELVSLVKNETQYKLKNVLTSYCDLFERFCPNNSKTTAIDSDRN
jgi:hypothetical protein